MNITHMRAIRAFSSAGFGFKAHCELWCEPSCIHICTIITGTSS